MIDGGIEDFYPLEFTVYNPDGSVGVSCDGRGQVSALMLDDEARSGGDVGLAEEVVALARLAREKYRMELRLHSLQLLETQGRSVDRMDRFYRGVQKLPTPEEYKALESTEFARRYPL